MHSYTIHQLGVGKRYFKGIINMIRYNILDISNMFLAMKAKSAQLLLLKALSHEKRLMLLEELCNADYCVSTLKAQLKVRQANVSQHLRILRDACLVRYSQKGKQRVYSINPRYRKLVQMLLHL
jgi:DNA-binding transcriptional ArsR family regulator